MVDHERRAAPRYHPPEGVTAEIGNATVRLIDLSLVGAKVEHNLRFALAADQLVMKWKGRTAALGVRVARSEIVARRGDALIYRTGLYFVDLDSTAQGFIASLLQEAQSPAAGSQSAPAVPPQELDAVAIAPKTLDDTWTRQVRLLRDELDEDLPYAQFRLTSTGWLKEYVASPVQPADGFTISRERHDFHELQRTFEFADEETRRMMQIALESQLLSSASG